MSTKNEEFRSNFKIRLREARKKTGLNQTVFAERIGIARDTLSRYERGDLLPSVEVLAAIIKETEISADWFLMGKGSCESLDDIDAGLFGAICRKVEIEFSLITLERRNEQLARERFPDLNDADDLLRKALVRREVSALKDKNPNILKEIEERVDKDLQNFTEKGIIAAMVYNLIKGIKSKNKIVEIIQEEVPRLVNLTFLTKEIK
ncbi:MAG: helix-turn-helix domain-containing protein [Magnetococcus sp. THC-1_WYH]